MTPHRALLALAAAASAAEAANRWSQSSVVLLRVNDDVLGGPSSQPIWLDEVAPATGVVLNSLGPLVGRGPNARFATLSTVYPRDGWMQRSADRRFLTFMAMVRGRTRRGGVPLGAAGADAGAGAGRLFVLANVASLRHMRFSGARCLFVRL